MIRLKSHSFPMSITEVLKDQSKELLSKSDFGRNDPRNIRF